MRTFASLFSGFGGADIGAMQAGLRPIWGVEYDPDIAGVAKANGLESMVADVREVDYSVLETPYWLHMSPVCKRASTANANATEAKEDIETAEACTRAITTLRPPYLSLENVRGYEGFSAFHLIVRCLMDEGYNVAWWVLNSADYGVPQTRERLILIASRVERVRKPIQTHAKEPPHDAQLSMFDTPAVKRWVGWLEAIEDLLPTLEDTSLAEWQWKFMPDEIKTMLVDTTMNNYGNSLTLRDGETPSFTITSSHSKRIPTAVLVDGTKQIGDMVTRDAEEPANTVLATTGYKRPAKAMVFQPNRSTWEDSNFPRGESEPIYTVKASIGGKTALPKAVLIEMTNTSRPPTLRDEIEPAPTIIAGYGRRPSHMPLVAALYRVIKLNSRCLARFQSFPDWYQLPQSNKLACTGIGNAKPPLLQQAVIEAQGIAKEMAA